MLDECYDGAGAIGHPVFVALRQTIEATGVPRELFADLIRAFEMDQAQTHMSRWRSLEEYSRYSANPVGRLVLWVSGYRDEERARLSDKVCTALQLANFWQDVVEDWERGRRYLPAERDGAVWGDGRGDRGKAVYAGVSRDDANRWWTTRGRCCAEGAACGRGGPGPGGDAAAVCAGGRAALDGVVAQDYDVLRKRPSVSKATKAKLLAGALVGKGWSWSARGRRGVTTEEAYGFCRGVAQREAKNFY